MLIFLPQTHSHWNYRYELPYLRCTFLGTHYMSIKSLKKGTVKIYFTSSLFPKGNLAKFLIIKFDFFFFFF